MVQQLTYNSGSYIKITERIPKSVGTAYGSDSAQAFCTHQEQSYCAWLRRYCDHGDATAKGAEGAKYRTLAVLHAVRVSSDMSERIEINPRVCGGQPVIKGRRIPVATVLEQLADDESWNALLQGYPELTREDIQAALEYARHSILHTEITAANQRGW